MLVCGHDCVSVSKGGLVLQQFVQEGSVPVADAHSGRSDVLQDVYSPPQAPVHVVSVPGRVPLPGHVDLDERALGFGGGRRRSHLETDLKYVYEE